MIKSVKFRVLCLGLLLSAAAAAAAEDTASYNPEPARYSVDVATFDWTDAERDRAVPVKIYFPKDAPEPLPIVIMSHGLGGSRDGYEYLGRCWAGRGYVSVHVQHLGSDSAVWQDTWRPRKAMSEAAANPKNATDRAYDVRFVIDQLARMNEEDPILNGRLNVGRVGVAGHSFGAHTALAVAGQGAALLSRLGVQMADPRVLAIIPMSAPAPQAKRSLDTIYESITIPCFHMTGTEDKSLIVDTSPEQRRIPYDHIHAANQYLLTFQGGDNMVFSGRPRHSGGGSQDTQFQQLICLGSTAFWDTYLKGDSNAELWLKAGGFEAALGDLGAFEQK